MLDFGVESIMHRDSFSWLCTPLLPVLDWRLSKAPLSLSLSLASLVTAEIFA